MTRTRLILICSFIICFAAGVAAGFLGGVLVRPAPRHHESRMTRGLNLTPQQTEQMDKIWPWPPPRRDQDPRMAALDKDREQAVTALLGEDLKAKYDDLISQYSAKRRALREQEDAERVEQTRKILGPDQFAKFQERLKEIRAAIERRGGRGGPGGSHAGPGQGGGPGGEAPPPPTSQLSE